MYSQTAYSECNMYGNLVYTQHIIKNSNKIKYQNIKQQPSRVKNNPWCFRHCLKITVQKSCFHDCLVYICLQGIPHCSSIRWPARIWSLPWCLSSRYQTSLIPASTICKADMLPGRRVVTRIVPQRSERTSHLLIASTAASITIKRATAVNFSVLQMSSV